MTNTELREKLVELMWEAGVFCVECPCGGDQIDEVERLADHLIENGVTFATDKNDGGKWISTTDYLPPPFMPVLVMRKNLKSRRSFYSVETLDLYDGGERFWSKDNVSWETIVTHWMQLPHPPKEK